MSARGLLVALVALSLVAWWWPEHWGWDPFVASKPGLPWLFAAVMFSLGCLLPRDEVQQVVRAWPQVLGGTGVQYGLMPLAAWALATVAQLPQEYFVGVVLVGCVPGAMASNVLTLTARGNVSYSISLTTLATVLSPVVVPVCLYVVFRQGHQYAALLAQKAFWILLTQVFGPVLSGHLLARWFAWLRRLMQCLGPWVANGGILWIIATVVALNRPTLATRNGSLWLVLLGLNGVGYLGGALGGWMLRLPWPMRKALVLEIGMQNAGLGTVLAAQLFPNHPQVQLPAALYTFGCMFTGALLAACWSRGKQEEKGAKAK